MIEETKDSSDDSEHCKLFMGYSFIVFSLSFSYYY